MEESAHSNFTCCFYLDVFTLFILKLKCMPFHDIGIKADPYTEQQAEVGLPTIWWCMAFFYLYTYTIYYSQSHHLFQTWKIPAISISTFLFVKASNDDVVGRCFTPFPIDKFCGCTSQFQHPSVTIVCFRCAGSNSVQWLESSVCCQKELLSYTPLKIAIEAKNHPVAKENHLSQISITLCCSC